MIPLYLLLKFSLYCAYLITEERLKFVMKFCFFLLSVCISNLCLTSASTDFHHMSRSPGSVNNTPNFRTLSSFSWIPFKLLTFFPSVYKTNMYKLSIPLHLRAIIKIDRSGFLDFWLATQTFRKDVHATIKQWL